MPLVVGELEPRKLELLRAEIAETLAVRFAYPPYFDHRAGKEIVRPLDRVKREEIEQFVGSINFAQVEHTDVSSPEVRRFLEQVLRRYLDVNPDLHRPHTTRRLPSLRGRIPRVAAEIHKSLQVFVGGTARDFGLRRPQRTWEGADTRSQRPSELLDHNTRVLETVLVRRGDEPPAPPAQVRAPAPSPAATPPHPARQPAVAPPARSKGAGPLGRWLAGASQATIPVQSPSPAPNSGGLPSSSPFASLATGAQSAIFGNGIAERPTGPVPIQGWGASGSPSGGSAPPPIPNEIFQLYGDYLHDMQPEAYERSAAPAPSAPPRAGGRMPPDDGMPTSVMPQAPAPPRAPRPVAAPPPAVPNAAPKREDARGDLLIFFQLRYQLEAYVRRGARSYGIESRSDDPSGVIDALRRSGFVDESDLQLAEGILAVTDRVAAAGVATVDDYRQAFMLYLLYHRSHLGQ